jgi:hypothetical protein
MDMVCGAYRNVVTIWNRIPSCAADPKPRINVMNQCLKTSVGQDFSLSSSPLNVHSLPSTNITAGNDLLILEELTWPTTVRRDNL